MPRQIDLHRTSMTLKNHFKRKTKNFNLWVRGLMAINVGCKFHDNASISNVCQITDTDLGH